MLERLAVARRDHGAATKEARISVEVLKTSLREILKLVLVG
jgi:hypothetical protein